MRDAASLVNRQAVDGRSRRQAHVAGAHDEMSPNHEMHGLTRPLATPAEAHNIIAGGVIGKMAGSIGAIYQQQDAAWPCLDVYDA